MTTPKPASAPPADSTQVLLSVAESLCELEVQARNASRAPTLGGTDKETVQRMLGRLADSLECQQQFIERHVAAANPLSMSMFASRADYEAAVAAAEPVPVALSDGGWIAYGDHRRIVTELEASLAACRALLNTCVDVIEEGLSDSQSYDYRPRAHLCAESIKRMLRQEPAMTLTREQIAPCEWKLDDSPYATIWESACGEAWSFTEGGPADNNVRFCHGCGKPVAVLPLAGEVAP